MSEPYWQQAFWEVKTAEIAYVICDPERGLSQEDEDIYTRRQKYSKATRHNVKPYGEKGPSTVGLGHQDS